MPKLMVGTLCAKKREYLHAGERVFHIFATASICAWALESLHGLCMSKHFQLHEFLRRAPLDMLQVYCAQSAILKGFEWGPRKSVDADRLARAIAAEPKEIAEPTKIHFRTIWELSGRGFTHGVLTQGLLANDAEAYAALKKLQSHLAKAFWTTLNRPKYVKKAKILSDVDQLPAGVWVKRGGLPVRPGPVDGAAVARLEAALINYFMANEHRGEECKIDCLRRGAEEIFFAYAADHPETELVWQGGKLESKAITPSFQLIFRHDDERRTLDIYFAGDRRKVAELQQVFGRAVLQREIPPPAPAEKLIYDLDRVLEPGFEFEYPPESGIRDARVTKVRFVMQGEPWARVLIEAENEKVRDALLSRLGELAGQPKRDCVLDQVHIRVRFEKQGDQPALGRDCIITSPNLLRLKKDDLGEKIEQLLIESRIERRVPEGEP